jgi:DNA-binding NarL/FixJ family response regulator
VLLVHQYDLARAGLAAALAGESDLTVMGSTPSGSEAINAVRRGGVDLVVVGERILDGTAAALCAALRAMEAGPAILLLTARPWKQTSGVECSPHAILSVAAGLSDFTGSIRAVGRAHRGWLGPVIGPAGADPISHLTQQQRAVAELVIEGCTNLEIARRLYISESTVRFHLQNLKRRLGARNKVEIVALVLRAGLEDRSVAC